MRYVALSIVLTASACGQEQQQQQAAPPPVTSEAAIPAETRVSRPPEVVPLPKDEAELDRLILAGYTPHANHMHPPGVKSCPLAKGGEAVM